MTPVHWIKTSQIKIIHITSLTNLFMKNYIFSIFAAGLGIEPKFSLSESDGLPLADPAIINLKPFLFAHAIYLYKIL